MYQAIIPLWGLAMTRLFGFMETLFIPSPLRRVYRGRVSQTTRSLLFVAFY